MTNIKRLSIIVWLLLFLVVGTAYGKDVVLTWDYPLSILNRSGGSVEFIVYENGENIGTTKNLTFTVAREPGVYSYYVTAKDEFWGQESGPSNTVSTPAMPTAPINLKVTVTVTFETK